MPAGLVSPVIMTILRGMASVSITFDVESPHELISSLFRTAAAAASLTGDQGLGRPWIELPADLFFRISTTLWSQTEPETILARMLRHFPEVQGVRVAGRMAHPISPSILELAPEWQQKKLPAMPDLTMRIREAWRKKAEEVIEQTPPGHFALFSAPAFEGDAMRFRLIYLPAARHLREGDQLPPGCDPALRWHVGPIKPEHPGKAR